MQLFNKPELVSYLFFYTITNKFSFWLVPNKLELCFLSYIYGLFAFSRSYYNRTVKR